jgi:hypothetical protein
VSLIGVPWPERTARARCHATNPPALAPDQSHDAPDPFCSCGIYALHRTTQFYPGMFVDSSVLGVVTLWGRLEVHEAGIRAEFARIEALALWPPVGPRLRRQLSAIASSLEVPLVAYEELDSIAGTLGAPVPEELLLDLEFAARFRVEYRFTDLPPAFRFVFGPGRAVIWPWLGDHRPVPIPRVLRISTQYFSAEFPLHQYVIGPPRLLYLWLLNRPQGSLPFPLSQPLPVGTGR